MRENRARRLLLPNCLGDLLIRIWRRWRATLLGADEARATFKTGVRVCWILLLAAGTLHRLLPTRRARLRSGDDSAGAGAGSNDAAGACGPIYIASSVI